MFFLTFFSRKRKIIKAGNISRKSIKTNFPRYELLFFRKFRTMEVLNITFIWRSRCFYFKNSYIILMPTISLYFKLKIISSPKMSYFVLILFLFYYKYFIIIANYNSLSFFLSLCSFFSYTILVTIQVEHYRHSLSARFPRALIRSGQKTRRRNLLRAYGNLERISFAYTKTYYRTKRHPNWLNFTICGRRHRVPIIIDRIVGAGKVPCVAIVSHALVIHLRRRRIHRNHKRRRRRLRRQIRRARRPLSPRRRIAL